MITRISLLSVFLFAVTFLSFNQKAEACEQCSQMTWSQMCEQRLVRSGYTGPVANFCSPINSQAAYQCVDGLVTHGYRPFNSDMRNGCTWATECGITALHALFRNGYSVTGDFIRTVGGTNSWGQAQCFAAVFDRHYQNLTSYNIRSLCR